MKTQQEIDREKYWSEFPQPGTATVLSRYQVGNAQYAVMVEAKREVKKDINVVLYLVNPSLKEPVLTFEITIPVSSLGSRAYMNRSRTFDLELFKADVLGGMNDQALRAEINPDPEDGIWGPHVNQWVDQVYRMPKVMERGEEIAKRVIVFIAKARTAAGVKPPAGQPLKIKVVKR